MTVSIPALSAKEYKAGLELQASKEKQKQAGVITTVENALELVEVVTCPKSFTKKIVFTVLRYIRDKK